ncbi:MAG: hypothetical protein V3V49_11575 [Candidatus Krumholzibacteria bacterium]
MTIPSEVKGVDRGDRAGKEGEAGSAQRAGSAFLFARSAFSHLASAGAQAVLDFLVEDLCALCGSGRVPGPTACEAAGLSGYFLRPVTRSFLRIISLRNHPVCERCAGGFEPGRTAGLLGWADAGRAVTTTTGERFEPPNTGDEPAVDTEPGPEIGGPQGQVSIPIVAPFMTRGSMYLMQIVIR